MSEFLPEQIDAMREWVLERCAGRLTRDEVFAASPLVIFAFVHGTHPVGVSAFAASASTDGRTDDA